MLLDIRHITQYKYTIPVRESVMEVWMQPQKSIRQRLISFDLDLDPPSQLFSYADSFGNAVHHFDVPQPHDQLTITARAAVESQAPPRLPKDLDMGEWDRLRSDFLQGENFDFLHPHGFARETASLRKYEIDHAVGDLRLLDPLKALLALNETIYDSFAYETGVTRADSPIDHVLKSRKGVCQDFAHVMIAICRSWGIPARYVSGYLFTDRKHGDRSDPDATHAWVEVFLPSLRWFGLDPTNNTIVGERHITCAVGRDYSDVPPSRGVYKGGTESALDVGVSVRKARGTINDPEFMRVSRRGPAPSRRVQPNVAAYEEKRRHEMQQQQQ